MQNKINNIDLHSYELPLCDPNGYGCVYDSNGNLIFTFEPKIRKEDKAKIMDFLNGNRKPNRKKFRLSNDNSAVIQMKNKKNKWVNVITTRVWDNIDRCGRDATPKEVSKMQENLSEWILRRLNKENNREPINIKKIIWRISIVPMFIFIALCYIFVFPIKWIVFGEFRFKVGQVKCLEKWAQKVLG